MLGLIESFNSEINRIWFGTFIEGYGINVDKWWR